MKIPLTMMILKLLLMSDLWLSVIDISNARHVKKNISKEFNACNMTSNKMVGLVCVKR